MYDRPYLIDYLPPVIQDVTDYQAITQTEQPEIKLNWQGVSDAYDDQFIKSATINGVERWEKILEIIPKADDTLDERKFRILTMLNEQLPFTIRKLRIKLDTLCGKNNYTMELNNYTLLVKVELTAKNNIETVVEMLKRVVPANIIVNVELRYNRHMDLRPYTHEQLSHYTHKQLREDVLKING